MGDLLSAASLLTAIVAALYALWFEEIVQALATAIDPHTANRVAPRRRVTAVLVSRAVPLVVAAAGVFLVFVPPTAQLITQSWSLVTHRGVQGVEYDAVVAAFIVVELFAFMLALDSCIRLVRLWALRGRLR